MPGQEVADRLFVRLGILTQKSVERHQDARGAKSALKRVMTLERRLQNAEAIGRGRNPFHRPHRASLDLHRKGQAGAGRYAVDVDGAGPADAVLATDMRAGRTD